MGGDRPASVWTPQPLSLLRGRRCPENMTVSCQDCSAARLVPTVWPEACRPPGTESPVLARVTAAGPAPCPDWGRLSAVPPELLRAPADVYDSGTGSHTQVLVSGCWAEAVTSPESSLGE